MRLPIFRRSNLGPILHRFRDIAGFLLITHPYCTRFLAVFPLDQIADVEVSPSQNFKLISREITFGVFQPVLKTYLKVRDRRTDRQTDGRLSVA